MIRSKISNKSVHAEFGESATADSPHRVTSGVMPDIEYEHDWMVRAINDGKRDYYLRLAKLIDRQYNVIQLKGMEKNVDGRLVVDLGPRTDTVNAPRFTARAEELEIEIELT